MTPETETVLMVSAWSQFNLIMFVVCTVETIMEEILNCTIHKMSTKRTPAVRMILSIAGKRGANFMTLQLDLLKSAVMIVELLLNE